MFSGTDGNYQSTAIMNDGFWPDIEIADFERRGVVPADMDPTATAGAVLAAVAEVNLQLLTVKASLVAEGYNNADMVPGPELAPGLNQTCELYLQAVFYRAKAGLISEYNTVTQRAAANNQAERSRETRDNLMAESMQRVRTLKGLRRVGVSLI